jgi:uroporphyrinogen decarboxylase
MAECKCDNISIDENIPLDYVRAECEKHGISYGGNLQLTSVLLLGEPIDAQKNAIACMEIAGERLRSAVCGAAGEYHGDFRDCS